MRPILLRPADPDRDFAQLAAWFSTLEDEPSTESGLKNWYHKHRDRIIHIVAEDDQGQPLGFYWATRDRSDPTLQTFYLFVRPEQRGQGLGRRLYGDLLRAVKEARTTRLRINIWDSCTEGLAFATRRGFIERRHQIAMALDLDTFDDRPYDAIIARLTAEGFRFTSMQELGNTEEAQHKLYLLNDAAAADTPGTDGEHPWSSFEDFQTSVCRSDWFKPDGQIVAIDTTAGAWVAMSAITRLEGNDYAYNLFTGVDRLYRGRKLAQAVKVLALRYARDVLQVDTVRTHHNIKNAPMIAIDLKLGYTHLPGTYLLEKPLG